MEKNIYRIALAGNPNVGKSTVFNALTGLHQHTGNWAGKTVEGAEGTFMFHMKQFQLTDLPGTYSLQTSSAEEQAAREFLCIQQPDAVIVVCDACCLERNLPLALQIAELCPHVVVCVNLMDEAEKKGIQVDVKCFTEETGIPAIGICAKRQEDIETLLNAVETSLSDETKLFRVQYEPDIEASAQILADLLHDENCRFPERWAALRLLEGDADIENWLQTDRMQPHVIAHMDELRENLLQNGWDTASIQDSITASVIHTAETLAQKAVLCPQESDAKERKADRILLGKAGAAVLLLLLGCILWLTAAGANTPSDALAKGFGIIGEWLKNLFQFLHIPAPVTGLLIDGVYKTTAWVVSVMLPPMAIFFPLFTLLEDAGYLPRAAFLLDPPLRKCGACGKQALTMCMGLGCNACGVTGCRIIESPRERLIAILTNVFMPCNGRFPMLITLTAILCAGQSTVFQAAALAGVILMGVGTTFAVSGFLSKTLLRGEKSAFILELPPYRMPQLGKTLLRSLLDRTIFVLGRAVAVAAPAGAILWLTANIKIGGISLLHSCAEFLDPAASVFGMDGMIFLAFILGLPANEIVMPILLMGYVSHETLTETQSLQTMHEILTANGWTTTTILCVLIFTVMHFPCSTTLLTIRKETGSLKWTAFAALLPTLCGLLVCFCIHAISILL